MQSLLEFLATPMNAERLSAANLADKTDAGTGSDGICFVSDDFRSWFKALGAFESVF